MNSIIEQFAIENGIAINDVKEIFSGFSALLLSKVPELKQVIEDVIVNEEPGKLKKHLNEMIILLQEKNTVAFKTWSMPQQSYIFRQSESGVLF